MRVFLTALMVVLLPLAAQAEERPPRIFVEASSSRATLEDALTAELGEGIVTSTTADADLWVVVDGSKQLQLRVVAPPDTVVAKQRFGLEHGIAPAIRGIVLVVADAWSSVLPRPSPNPPAPPETEADPATEPDPLTVTIPTTTPASPPPTTADRPLDPPRSAPRRFHLRVAVAAEQWAEPGALTTGLTAGAQRRFSTLRLGIQLGLSGLGCCRVNSDRVTGRPLDVDLLVDAEWVPLTIGAVAISALARGGVRYERFTGRGRFTPDGQATIETSEQTESGWGPVGQFGVGLSYRLTQDVLLGAFGGIELRTSRLTVAPPAIAGEEVAVDAGRIAPWLQIAVGWDLF